jgi:hypothetical protein
MIAEANGLDIVAALVTGSFLLAGMWLTSWLQNRKTRTMNTLEHERSAAERAANREAVLLAVEMVHAEVLDTKADVKDIKSEQQVIKGDLRAHINDDAAHGAGVKA